MLISYRDSKRYPSDPLGLQTWVRLGEFAARQVNAREFDPARFARALHICRRLTCTEGPEGIRRIILACAAAGVCVVLVPGIEGCHASSASRWLIEGKRAMIALSLRYRRDDHLYFSLFREAGAILAAAAGQREFNPDAFARDFLIPPEHNEQLWGLIQNISPPAVLEARSHGGDVEGSGAPPCLCASVVRSRILSLAKQLQIAPGLVVGRLQHDGLITWKQHNALKRQVDLNWVLESAAAVEETWPDQQAATEAVMKDFNLIEQNARRRVKYALAEGQLLTNGQSSQRMRFEPGALAAWRLAKRDRDLDAEDRDEAEAA